MTQSSLKLNISDQVLFEGPISWKNHGTKLTEFDQMLQSTWVEAEKNQMFNYSLNDSKYKSLIDYKDGNEYKCWTVFNINRINKRRAPLKFSTMKQKYDPNKFNFTKILKDEILFELIPKSLNSYLGSKTCSVIINKSPIDKYHVLLVPELNGEKPQHVTCDSLLIMFDVVQMSSQPSFRLGFNSLHAWASVNHLHYHAMYGENEVFLDEMENGEELAENCFLSSKNAIMPHFVFMVPNEVTARTKVARNVCKLIDEVLCNDNFQLIPYSLVITRGNTKYKTRCFIFPRKSSEVIESSDIFNVACIEVSGHLSIRSEDAFDNLNLDTVVKTLENSKIEDTLFKELVDRFRKTLI